MGLNYARLNQEDRRYWDYLLNQTRGGTSGGSPSGSGGSGEPPEGGSGEPAKHTEPYEDPDLGTVAYDEFGHLLKKPKEKKQKKPLSRNAKDKLWGGIGAAVGGMLAGGVGASAGQMLFSPRFRKNAQNKELPHTMNVPQSQDRDEPLSEPNPENKDAGKTRSQRFIDWAEKKQVGQGLSDYEDDYIYNRNNRKWGVGADESVKSILTEAINRLRSGK